MSGGRYVIRCQVSGGVTGTREGLLKENGEVRYFSTATEADAEALRLTAAMNGPHAKAQFRYWLEKSR